MTRASVLIVLVAGASGVWPANNGRQFTADRYYFELSYGQGMEFYEEKYIEGSAIWKLNFKSILRIELPPGHSYRGFTVPPSTETARLAWNPSKTLQLATFGEYAIILSPQFHMLKAFRNTQEARWLNNEEIFAIVGDRSPAEYALNIQTERFRVLKTSRP